MSLAPRAVVVHRASELDGLVERHGTRGQAEFFLQTRGRTLAEAQRQHDALGHAVAATSRAVPADWRRGSVERADLHRFDFQPGDVVFVVGQDGLVANVAKYLDGQPVVGVDPEPGRNAGVLVRHDPGRVAAVVEALVSRRATIEDRTLVRAELDDGTAIDALNEVFVGHGSHQSARYRLFVDGRDERQSSSGLIVATGTGATGWAASISRERGAGLPLPSAGSDRLAWFVREAWPSPVTGTTLTTGVLTDGASLDVVVQSESLVVFGDGLEADRLTATWGQAVHVSASARRLRLVL